jgi:hypothetical protein
MFILLGCFIAHTSIGCIALGAFLIIANASPEELNEESKNS